MGVVVDDVGDATGLAENSCVGVDAVAFGFDAFVPVVERSCCAFTIDRFGPGVVAGWLVEGAVQNDWDPIAGHGGVGVIV